jgi:hypothetical protein
MKEFLDKLCEGKTFLELIVIRTDISTYISDKIKTVVDKGEDAKLVGHLNKAFGYNGYKPVEVGTEVFELDNSYFFTISPLNSDKTTTMKFYKKDLSPCINFINK